MNCASPSAHTNQSPQTLPVPRIVSGSIPDRRNLRGDPSASSHRICFLVVSREYLDELEHDSLGRFVSWPVTSLTKDKETPSEVQAMSRGSGGPRRGGQTDVPGTSWLPNPRNEPAERQAQPNRRAGGWSGDARWPAALIPRVVLWSEGAVMRVRSVGVTTPPNVTSGIRPAQCSAQWSRYSTVIVSPTGSAWQLSTMPRATS